MSSLLHFPAFVVTGAVTKPGQRVSEKPCSAYLHRATVFCPYLEVSVHNVFLMAVLYS